MISCALETMASPPLQWSRLQSEAVIVGEPPTSALCWRASMEPPPIGGGNKREGV